MIAVSGPIREIYIFSLKLFSSMNTAVSQKTNFQLEQITNASELIKEQKASIDELKQEIKTCHSELGQTRRIARKVLALDDLLKTKTNYFPASVGANIIARSPSSWHQEVIIDKGHNSGIQAGMVVVTEKGLLGQIQDVKANYSIVQLMSSLQIRFGVTVRRVGVMGILFGDRGGYAQLKFIPIGSDIKKGDIVQTSGISPSGIRRLFPIDYPVGQVMEVGKDGNNSEMFIKVKLFEDGYSLKSGAVLVLLPEGNKASLAALYKTPLETQALPEENAEAKPIIEVKPVVEVKPTTTQAPPNINTQPNTNTQNLPLNSSPSKPKSLSPAVIQNNKPPAMPNTNTPIKPNKPKPINNIPPKPINNIPSSQSKKPSNNNLLILPEEPESELDNE